MTSQVGYLDKPVREIPQVIMNGVKEGYKKVADWTHKAKDWTVANKEPILKALKIAASIVSILGLALGVYGILSGNLFAATERVVTTASCFQRVTTTELAFNIGSGFKLFFAGASLFFLGDIAREKLERCAELSSK